jgi:hypothetical protein
VLRQHFYLLRRLTNRIRSYFTLFYFSHQNYNCKLHTQYFICLFSRLCGQSRAMAFSFTRFLDHTQRRATVSRSPLDEWSARRRDLYLRTHNTHNRETDMPPSGIRTNDLSRRTAADLHFRPRGHWDRPVLYMKRTYWLSSLRKLSSPQLSVWCFTNR